MLDLEFEAVGSGRWGEPWRVRCAVAPSQARACPWAPPSLQASYCGLLSLLPTRNAMLSAAVGGGPGGLHLVGERKCQWEGALLAVGRASRASSV